MKRFRLALIFLGFALITFGCAPAPTINTPLPRATTTSEWFDMELTDVQSAGTFTMNDYAGKVVLLQTMAIWCPNCVVQGNEVRNLHKALGNPPLDPMLIIDRDGNVHHLEYGMKDAETLQQLVTPIQPHLLELPDVILKIIFSPGPHHCLSQPRFFWSSAQTCV